MNEETPQPNTTANDTDKFKRLYVAVSETNGMPTISQLKEIIQICKEDFPEPPQPNY